MQHTDSRTDAMSLWVKTLSTRRHSNVVACALANKAGADRLGRPRKGHTLQGGVR